MRVEEHVSVNHLDGLDGELGQAAAIINAIVGAASAGFQAYSQVRAQKTAEKEAKKTRAQELALQAQALKQMAERQAAAFNQDGSPTTTAVRSASSNVTPIAIAGSILLLGLGALIILRKR